MLKGRLYKVIWVIFAFVVFGPFLLIYVCGFLGIAAPEGRFFEIWLMGALTCCGIIATFWFAESIKYHGIRELGCVLPIAAVTCWWGYGFLRMIGLM